MRFLSFFKQHTVTIEPHLGTDGYGRDRWGPAVNVAGWLDETTKLVRNKDGSEVTSTSQFHCDLTTNCPQRSRATLPSGKVTLAISASRRDGGALPLPTHLEIAFE